MNTRLRRSALTVWTAATLVLGGTGGAWRAVAAGHETGRQSAVPAVTGHGSGQRGAAAGTATAAETDWKALFVVAFEKLRVKQARVFELEPGKHLALLDDGGAVVVTSEFARVNGYAGPSALAIRFTPGSGDVGKVVLLQTRDTPAYVRRVETRLSALEKQRLDTAERPVLAVSGATRTARGWTGTVNQTLDQLQPLLAQVTLGRGTLTRDGKRLEPVWSWPERGR